MYTDENSIYNPILNEWDCSEFGKSEGSDSESGCDDYGDPYIDDEAQACDTDSTPFLTTITSAAGHDFEFKTLWWTRAEHQWPGFSQHNKLELCNAVGHLGGINDFMSSTEGKAAMVFLLQWSSNSVSTPSSDFFDLSYKNHQ